MPQDLSDWPLITRPPLDRRTVVRTFGILVMLIGLLVLLVDAVQEVDRVDVEFLGAGLCMFGGFLRL